MTTLNHSLSGSNEPRRVYHWKWRGLLVTLLAAILLFFLCSIGPVLFNSGPIMSPGLRLFVIILFMLLADLVALLCLGVWNFRVVTSPQGLEYYNIGFSIRSPWSHLASRQSIQTNRGRTLSGIGLKQPALQMDSWFSTATQLMPFLSLIALLRGRVIIPTDISAYAGVIPVGDIVPDWESGELGDTIQQYAPQVFAPETEGGPVKDRSGAEQDALDEMPSVPPVAVGRTWLRLLVAAGIVIGEAILVYVLLGASGGESPIWSTRCGWVDQIAVSPDNLIRAACNGTIYTWRLSGSAPLWRVLQNSRFQPRRD